MNFSLRNILQSTVVSMSTFLALGVEVCFASQNDFPEQSIIQELPVVLSPSRLRQPLSEAPNAMTVIDRAMIKASGFRNIPDLFKLVPGMYVSYYSGNSASVGYHGLTEQYARRMQVLVDGRSVYLPPVGGVTWEDLPLQIEDIERIEVIRGTAAASHGGNSIQGVISIITRDAGAQQGFKASVTKGNGGISDVGINFGNRGDKLDYRVSLGYRSDDGYDVSQYDPNYDSQTTRQFNLRTSYQPNSKDSFDVQLGYSKGSRGVDTADIPHDAHSKENFQQVTWLRSMDGGNEFKLLLYRIYRDKVDSFGFASDNETSTRNEIEMQITKHISLTNRLVWGASIVQDWVRAPTQFLAEQSLREKALFAHDEWRITPQWIFNTGAMLEDNGMGQKNASPRVAVNYHLRETQTLRVGISRAYRNPTLLEERVNYHFIHPVVGPVVLYQSMGGLKPESILSREIGYLGEFPDKGFSINARLYLDQLSHIIYVTLPPPPAPPIPTVVNLFNAQHKGLEITTKHHWGDRSLLTFNYSRQHITSDREDYNQTVPDYMISALYSTSFAQSVALSLGYYQQAAVLPMDRPEYDRQQFTRRVDVRIAKKFKMNNHGGDGEIALVVQHPITDKYIDYRRRNEFNRRAYLTATFNF